MSLSDTHNQPSALQQDGLYPLIEPFKSYMLHVDHGHQIYVEECGNPNGLPVIVLHGGPGAGCQPAMRRFFNPKKYHIILFDQRGCGRSKPFASVEANTTQHLISDIETIRQNLGIERWFVFGGSWGSTLSLAYAQAHPDKVRALILRGIFMLQKSEIDWFYEGGAAAFFPQEWESYKEHIPEDERDNYVAAYHKRLFSGNKAEEIRYAVSWSRWEHALATISNPTRNKLQPSQSYSHAFARIENHYFYNRGFLDHDGQLFTDLPKIKHIPTYIVQGRYDMICPPQTAYKLASQLDNAELIFCEASGHAMSEPEIRAELVNIMNKLSV